MPLDGVIYEKFKPGPQKLTFMTCKAPVEHLYQKLQFSHWYGAANFLYGNGQK